MIGHPFSCLPRRSNVKPGADAEPRRYNVWCCRMHPPVCRAIDWEDLGRFGRRAKPANSRLPRRSTTVAGVCGERRHQPPTHSIARLPRRSVTKANRMRLTQAARNILPNLLKSSQNLPSRHPPTPKAACTTARLLWRSLFFLPFSGGCCYYYAEEYQ